MRLQVAHILVQGSANLFSKGSFVPTSHWCIPCSGHCHQRLRYQRGNRKAPTTYHQGAKLARKVSVLVRSIRTVQTHNSTRAGLPFPMYSSKLSGLSSRTFEAATAATNSVAQADMRASMVEVEKKAKDLVVESDTSTSYYLIANVDASECGNFSRDRVTRINSFHLDTLLDISPHTGKEQL